MRVKTAPLPSVTSPPVQDMLLSFLDAFASVVSTFNATAFQCAGTHAHDGVLQRCLTESLLGLMNLAF